MATPAQINALCDQARALGSVQAALALESQIYDLLKKSHPDALYLIRSIMDLFQQHRMAASLDFDRASDAFSLTLKPTPEQPS